MMGILFCTLLSFQTATAAECDRLLDRLNRGFLALHSAKEAAFWSERMAHKDADPESLGVLGKDLNAFLSDAHNLELVEKELKRTDLGRQEQLGLEGLRNMFAVNTITSPAAADEYSKLVDVETALSNARTHMPLGYIDPHTQQFVEATPKKAALILATEPDESVRLAAFEGLRKAEELILAAGFIETFRQRNALARSMGYSDFYAFKLKTTEGMTKEQVFAVLDDLEVRTREACKQSLDDLITEKGPEALHPWNYNYFSSGDLANRVDPYFPPAYAFERWGRTFAALGVNYRGATLKVDLIDRPRKYNNGFMHGPLPSYVDRNGFHPAQVGFTSNAMLESVGAGQDMAKTLHHEGGHASHFANGFMPSPAYHQEFAPTSVATAETQSMFMDSFLNDPLWLLRYAKTVDGKPMPVELLKEVVIEHHRSLARQLRYMLIIPFFERALYEMPDDQLTPENILKLARDTENKLVFADSAKPAITIPHLLQQISSAYYHGYVLAELAVYQTRAYFLKKYGYIVDNPKIAREMTKKYWAEGNRRSFFEFVQ
jgi:hypothetical protein